jgi:UDP-N-acetylmuramoyl-L-alanyl-D-glutamate--2,6-diaminopimelate ligase
VTRSLAELAERLRVEGRLRTADGDLAFEPTGIADDSRRVEPGNLFVAVRGLRVDGHHYVAQAIGRGAAAVIVEAAEGELAVPQLIVDRGAASLASAAAWWHGDPSRELLTVGVTGTNGKTTTSFLAALPAPAFGPG